MTHHQRRNTLSDLQKQAFKSQAEQFLRHIRPMMRDLKAFGPRYKALLAISRSIDVSYDVLDIHKPDRLRIGQSSEPPDE